MMDQGLVKEEYLLGYINEIGFLFDTGFIEKVLTKTDVNPLPLAPDELVGVIDYQSNIIPIFSLSFTNPEKNRLPSSSESLEIVIFHVEDTLYGLIIDNLIGLKTDITEKEDLSEDKIFDFNWITKQFEMNQEVLYEIKPDLLWNNYLIKLRDTKEKKDES